MKRLLSARLVLAFIGIAVWGYGHAAELPNVRLAGMGVLLVALLLRFVPRRWVEDEDRS